MKIKCYNDLFMRIIDEVRAFEFALEKNLIKRERICECGAELKWIKDEKQRYKYRFSCTQRRSVCKKTYSILHGTWFAKSKLSIRDQILVIYCYCLEMENKQIDGMLNFISKNTSVDWNNYFHDLCSIYLSELNNIKIGGAGMIVECDETKIFKNKNHIGRLTSEQETHEWLFGGICRETKETFFVIVPNRNEETLINAICENINEGSHIITDCWRSYLNIQSYGYIHSTINHSENFINPNDQNIHTQTIERVWRGVKNNIPNGGKYQTRIRYISQYSFKKRTNWYNKSSSERFNLLLELISIYY